MKKEQKDSPPERYPAPAGPAAGDYYYEDGLLVMTAAYLRRRGYCCGNGCRHCPYGPDDAKPA